MCRPSSYTVTIVLKMVFLVLINLNSLVENNIDVFASLVWHTLVCRSYRNCDESAKRSTQNGTALNDLSSFGLYFFNSLTNINDENFQKKVLLFHPLIVMKVPSGVEWYNILILGLALIGIVVNISCLVLILVKRRKCSMFFTLIKVCFFF